MQTIPFHVRMPIRSVPRYSRHVHENGSGVVHDALRHRVLMRETIPMEPLGEGLVGIGGSGLLEILAIRVTCEEWGGDT